MATVIEDPVAAARERGGRPQRSVRRPDQEAVATDPVSEEARWAASGGPLISVDAIKAQWEAAFEAAQAALRAASIYLPADELHERNARLGAEREPTANLLRALARDRHAHAPFLQLMVSQWEARRWLGLPAGITACVFNLNGVLIGSTALHAAAWMETFDEFISRRVERTGGHFAPFDPRVDYQLHIHGRPRLEGVRTFLASRGVRLPEGHPDDPPGLETVHGLANRKNRALLRRLDEHGVHAFEGSRRYLELARAAGVHCAVVSASANTQTILERAGLAHLIEESVDGNTIVAQRLHRKPAPDTLLAACRQLGVAPTQAAAFETTPAGIAAGRAAGCGFVVGIDDSGHPDALRAEDADLVVTGLAELLERTLAA